MAVTIEYKEGIIYVDDKRVAFLKDAQHCSAPFLMGLDYDSGNQVIASMTADGKLNVGGITLEGATVDVGDVVLIGRPEDALKVKASILDDGFGHGAIYVQSVQMATSAKQDAQSALLTTIDNSIHSQINTPTSQLKTVLDTISATLITQLDETSGNIYVALGVIDASINAQVDMKTSVLGGKIDLSNTRLLAIDVSVNAQIDTKTSVLNASLVTIDASINTQVDTKTSVINASLATIDASINTQIDTKTSVLNASLATIDSSIATTNAELVTANASLVHLTDATQKTQVIDGSGNVIAATSNAMNVYMTGGASISVSLDHTTDSIAIWGTDGTINRFLKTNVGGQLEAVIISSALPAGASTEVTLLLNKAELVTANANLVTINATLGTIKSDTASIASSNTAIDTKLLGLTNNSQKAQMIDASGNTLGIGAKPIFVDDSPMGKENIHTVYTYYTSGNGNGKTETIKEYPTGAGGGSPAKLTTYTYNANTKVESIVVSDTTV